MNASPSSPPTMCTPPSGIESPAKNIRTSMELADHGKFCSRIIQLMVMCSFSSTQLEIMFLRKLASAMEQEDKGIVQSQLYVTYGGGVLTLRRWWSLNEY